MISVAGDGTVYVTRRSVGDVIMLRDRDRDGRADAASVVVASRPEMHGIAITGSTMYLVTIHDLYRTQIRPDGTLAPLERLVDDLADAGAGQHEDRMVVVGPDGMLYATAGSTCYACDEANPENATMLRVAPDAPAAASSRRGCATRSGTASCRGRGKSTAWTTASTGSVTTCSTRS